MHCTHDVGGDRMPAQEVYPRIACWWGFGWPPLVSGVPSCSSGGPSRLRPTRHCSPRESGTILRPTEHHWSECRSEYANRRACACAELDGLPEEVHARVVGSPHSHEKAICRPEWPRCAETMYSSSRLSGIRVPESCWKSTSFRHIEARLGRRSPSRAWRRPTTLGVTSSGRP